MSSGLLKAKWKNDNFSTYAALLNKDLQMLENLLITWIEFLNVDPQSPIDAFVRD